MFRLTVFIILRRIGVQNSTVNDEVMHLFAVHKADKKKCQSCLSNVNHGLHYLYA
jgi:hypothetical protein